MPTEADLLADLLDGVLDPADAPAELVELAGFAADVRTYVLPLPPSPAFRAALREDLLQVAGAAPAGAGATAGGATAGGTGGAGAAAGMLPTVVAAVAATVVLAGGGAALTAESLPGDALYGAKRAVESVQLAVADDERDVELLAGAAVERLREAVDVADAAVANDLLRESDRLLDDALTLALAQGRDVDGLVRRQTGALLTLGSRTEDPVVDANVRQLLADLGAGSARRPAEPDTPSAGSSTPSPATQPDDGPAPGPDAPVVEPDGTTGGKPPDDPASELPGGPTSGDATDTVEDLLDDATGPAADLLEPSERGAGDVLDTDGLGG